MKKAQATLEFLGGFTIFILSVIAVFSLAADEVSQFNEYAQTAEKNLEAKATTDLLLTSSGQDVEGNANWHETSVEVETIGLADDYMVVNQGKLDSFTNSSDEADVHSYNSLVNDLELEYNYHFSFRRFPIVETHRTFEKGNPPNKPAIDEPNTDFYNKSDNRVHYGNVSLQGQSVNFLVVGHNGEYNTTYVKINSWDFNSDKNMYGERDSIEILDTGNLEQDFVIENIQNREDRPGASVVLSSEIGEFGRSRETIDQNVEKLNRYPILKNNENSRELMKVEVLVW